MEQVDEALDTLRAIFGVSLQAVYLHGSAVTGGLKPSSDLDLLAVIDRPMTDAQRASLLSALLRISARYPVLAGDRRPLEVIVFLRSTLTGPAIPTRAEFLYGEWLRVEFEAGMAAGPVINPDIVLMLAQARRTAHPLLGPEVDALLPLIGISDICAAMRAALPALMADLDGDARNVLLTLARMWRTAAMGDFVAKDVAAAWAMPQIPEMDAALLGEARVAYLGGRPDDLDTRPGETERAAILMRRRILELL